MTSIDLDLLLAASRQGGGSCLSSVTELEPAGGEHTSVAPAKFASADKNKKGGVYAFEQRFLDGILRTVAIIDSKQSQLNRVEEALQLAIEDKHPLLSRVPRIEVVYRHQGGHEERHYDLTLPHRAYDGHFRAATRDGKPAGELAEYRALRDATPANARALLEGSPVTLVFGGWDSMRKAHQSRWRSALVGEIIGFCANDRVAMRGGARVDPVGMSINLSPKNLVAAAERQRGEMSGKKIDAIAKSAAGGKGAKKDEPISASSLVLGGIPPALNQLAGVACDRIIRSHVLSMATLRQMRFGADAEGNAACRALLAALALNGLARSDSELRLRANCDLTESGASEVVLDQRFGAKLTLDALTIEAADELLEQALGYAEKTARINWKGQVLSLDGDPAIIAGSVDEEPGEDADA